jgi:hypothetical protein
MDDKEADNRIAAVDSILQLPVFEKFLIYSFFNLSGKQVGQIGWNEAPAAGGA